MQPKMFVIAGPPGGGKSTAFPVAIFGVDCFNADDRAAELNGASYQNVPLSIRERVSQEFENFVLQHIEQRVSFAIETTLRTSVTFDQAKLALRAGFQVEMLYVNAGEFEDCLNRVIGRALAGGHSAPPAQLRAIYVASLHNLGRAVRAMPALRVYDNSVPGSGPRLLLETRNGNTTFQSEALPDWLAKVLSDAD